MEFLRHYQYFNSFLKEKIKPCIVVFGSFAKFKADKRSDLDLLIVGEGELPYHLLPYKIHKIELSDELFEKSIFKKETLAIEIIRTTKKS